MPYVAFETSLKLDDSKKQVIKDMIGEIIQLIPGKTVEVTMFNINDGLYLKKGVSSADCVFIDVRLRGAATFEGKNAFVTEISRRLNEQFNIQPSCVYVNFLEFDVWGSNGSLH
jgi:phenylpyruvate tautomerase PptA (4-oxalocrotonate tautomerase family)